MGLRDLDYQGRVLSRLDDYLQELVAKKAKADRIAALSKEQPELGLEVPDFPLRAWEALKAAGRLPENRMQVPCSPRHDGIGRPVPNIVFKVPTGSTPTARCSTCFRATLCVSWKKATSSTPAMLRAICA